MVDSSPRSVGPPSMISGIRPPRLFSTCSARVGLIEPLALADGAASGRPTARSKRLHRRMRRHAKADRRQPGGDERAIARISPQRHDQRQRSGPMLRGQRASLVTELADPLRGREVGDVDDQRVEAGPALGLVDPRDCLGVGRVGGEAVDRLGRHRDRLAGEDQPRGFGDALVTEGKDPRFASGERGLHENCATLSAALTRRARARSARRHRSRAGASARGSPAILP